MKALLDRSLKLMTVPKWLQTRLMQMIICVSVIFLVVHISFVISTYDYPYDYQLGDQVTEDIVLPMDYIDVEATEQLKENVQYEIDTRYMIDASKYADAKQQIGEFFNQVYAVRDENQEDIDFRTRVLKYVLQSNIYNLGSEELDLIAVMDEHELRLGESYAYDAIKAILTSTVTEENFIEKQNSVQDYFSDVDQLTPEMVTIVTKIVSKHVVINSSVDHTATDALIEEEKAKIDDVVIPTGTVIAKKESILEEKAFQIINDLDLNNQHSFTQRIPMLIKDGIIVLFLILMVVILHFHYKMKHRRVSNKEIYMNFTIMFFMYLATYGFGQVSIYLIPVAALSMLISILDEVYTGIIFGFFLTIIYGVTFNYSPEIMIFTILSVMVTAVMVHGVIHRSRIFLAGLSASILYGLIIAAIGLLDGQGFKTTIELVMYGGFSGILCSILTIGSLPVWEQLFKILTPIKLLEYANPNHPLMKKLLLEAPGTYHHSILVANLSEAAAHDIGGNALLARVGAYFHDIGKIEKPYLFVENQYDGHNPHDQFVPRVSAKVIRDHVIKGFEMGKQYRLPKEILDFISQHHGTTLIKYFYHKALENLGETVDREAYAYTGPRPQTKEIAIVMMADSVEAAVRSLKQSDKEKVQALIEKIIQGKISDHQLDDSGLTLKEIDMITAAFIANLSSAFHERIEYPDSESVKHHINIIK